MEVLILEKPRSVKTQTPEPEPETEESRSEEDTSTSQRLVSVAGHPKFVYTLIAVPLYTSSSI